MEDMNERAKSVFRDQSDIKKKEISKVEELVSLNDYLAQHNWVFVHPYSFGAEVSILKRLRDENNESTELVSRVFAQSFFDLRTTTALVEGIFKKRPPIQPFCALIDQSIVLCLQQDYAGAICTLIPVIEGSMRHYLVNMMGKRNEQVMRSSELLKIFSHVREIHLSELRRYYDCGMDDYAGHGIVFYEQQIQQLLKLDAIYIDKWMSILTNYLENNLFLDTRSGVKMDNLNRHSIFHGFDTETFYNLSNYLKLFNCVCFLSWIFGMADPKASAFADVELSTYLQKWKSLEKIRLISAHFRDLKEGIFAGYPDYYNLDSLSVIPKNALDQYVSRITKSKEITDILRVLDGYFDSMNVLEQS